MKCALETCDIVRLDHFRGFESYWEIPADEPTAVQRQMGARGRTMICFSALRASLGDLPFIAEDLGLITEEVHASARAPGRARNEGAAIRLWRRRARTSTCRTTLSRTAWSTPARTTTTPRRAGGNLRQQGRAAPRAQTISVSPDDGMHWAFIRAAFASVARLAIVPLQDVLGLGSEARMNTPVTERRQLGLALCARRAQRRSWRRSWPRSLPSRDRVPQVYALTSRATGKCAKISRHSSVRCGGDLDLLSRKNIFQKFRRRGGTGNSVVSHSSPRGARMAPPARV